MTALGCLLARCVLAFGEPVEEDLDVSFKCGVVDRARATQYHEVAVRESLGALTEAVSNDPLYSVPAHRAFDLLFGDGNTEPWAR